ncbi:unnamed protein product [Coccothraustes coccothraustes]
MLCKCKVVLLFNISKQIDLTHAFSPPADRNQRTHSAVLARGHFRSGGSPAGAARLGRQGEKEGEKGGISFKPRPYVEAADSTIPKARRHRKGNAGGPAAAERGWAAAVPALPVRAALQRSGAGRLLARPFP